MKMTDHPLISMTEQEIFNEAYYGTYHQNQEQYVDEAYRSDHVYYIDEAYLINNQEDVLTLICQGHESPCDWLSPDEDKFWKDLDIDPGTVSPERKAFLALLRLTDHADTEEGPMEPLKQFAHEHGLQIPSDLD
jgi:hypothetical protein